MKHKIFVLLFVLYIYPLPAQIALLTYREEVIQHSYPLKIAHAQSEEAEGRLQRQKSAFLPSLSASGDFSLNLRHREGIKPWGFSLTPELLSTLYAGGATRASYQKAREELEAARAEEEFSLLDVRYAADYAYWNLSAMALFREAMAQYVEIIRSLKQVIDNRFQEGYIARGDLLMIEARLSTAEYELLTAEQNFEVALHNFNILRGAESDTPVTLQNSIRDSLLMPQRIGLGRTLAQRPDYAAATYRSRAAQSAIRVSRAAYNPQLQLGVRGIWQPDSPNRRGTTSLNGVLFARISIPIFHFGERRQAVRTAEAAARRVLFEEQALEEDILREERNGWSALIESRAQVDALAESLRIAGENLDLSTYSYGEGLTTILDVLQAQLNWIQIYTNAITARFNYAIARSAYERTTGNPIE